MNRYSATSWDRLLTCHHDWKIICLELIKYIDHSIFCGYRGEIEQNRAVASGNSELRWPLSKHNQYPSMAIDMGPYFKELKNTDWEDALAFAAFAGAVLTIAKQLYMAGNISHQVIWGGDWDSDGRTRDHKFRDYPHFELTEENVWNL